MTSFSKLALEYARRYEATYRDFWKQDINIDDSSLIGQLKEQAYVLTKLMGVSEEVIEFIQYKVEHEQG